LAAGDGSPAGIGYEEAMADPTNCALFSYGTLRQPEVQRATYGRLIEGRPDALLGYRLVPLAISSAEVVRLSGKAVHSIARRTGRREDRIEGAVFQLTAAELEATDAYEVDAYARREVRLESGLLAFAYVGPDD
jgi:gamma-glutamylcyclotransferase (GGCT)/AIG2-like uncharacterized protein YtfP